MVKPKDKRPYIVQDVLALFKCGEENMRDERFTMEDDWNNPIFTKI